MEVTRASDSQRQIVKSVGSVTWTYKIRDSLRLRRNDGPVVHIVSPDLPHDLLRMLFFYRTSDDVEELVRNLIDIPDPRLVVQRDCLYRCAKALNMKGTFDDPCYNELTEALGQNVYTLLKLCDCEDLAALVEYGVLAISGSIIHKLLGIIPDSSSCTNFAESDIDLYLGHGEISAQNLLDLGFELAKPTGVSGAYRHRLSVYERSVCVNHKYVGLLPQKVQVIFSNVKQETRLFDFSFLSCWYSAGYFSAEKPMEFVTRFPVCSGKPKKLRIEKYNKRGYGPRYLLPGRHIKSENDMPEVITAGSEELLRKAQHVFLSGIVTMTSQERWYVTDEFELKIRQTPSESSVGKPRSALRRSLLGPSYIFIGLFLARLCVQN